jgi:TetR/AcrR family transcriptional regulator
MGGAFNQNHGEEPAEQEQSLPPDGSVRERLLKAAVDLFHRKGYAATSVNEIVSATGVTKPVLYYYFQSKEGIFLELMKEGRGRFQAIVGRDRSAEAGTLADKIRRFCHETIDLFVENIHIVRVMYSIYYGPPQGGPFVDFDVFHDRFRSAMQGLVKDGMRSGEFREGDAMAMTGAILGTLSIFTESSLCHPDHAMSVEEFDRMLDVVFQGISVNRRTGPKERPLIRKGKP